MPTTHITSMNCAVCVGMIYAAILKEFVVFVYYHSMIDGFLSARWHNQLSYYGWEFDNLWVTAITGRHLSQLPEPLGHCWPQRNCREVKPAACGVTVTPSLLRCCPTSLTLLLSLLAPLWQGCCLASLLAQWAISSSPALTIAPSKSWKADTSIR